MTELGITDEPTVQAAITGGADVVTFSGDKLLGGPQAGIIVGKKRYIDKIKNHPLNRALRVDKMTLAALEATLWEYLYVDNLLKLNPTLKMLTVSEHELKEKAEKLASMLVDNLGDFAVIDIAEDYSEAGGGSLPTTKLATWVVRFAPKDISVKLLAEKLRIANPAILVRIADNKIILDLRTIKTGDFEIIKKHFYREISKR